jgi:hypothetical protein
VAAWEAATRRDPFFPLTVKWQPVGITIGQIIEGMLAAVAPARLPTSAMELAQILSVRASKNGSPKK